MDMFTIGQMAQMNHVTKKTLVIYHKKGLLVPEEVDPETGYRYYSLTQCSTLDMIQQLKHVGFSLTQIKDIVDKQDMSYTQNKLHRQIESLEKSRRDLELSISAAKELSATCGLLMNQPPCGTVTLEYVPRRRIIRFAVKPYVVQRRWSDDPHLSNWERSLRSIKRQLISEGFPSALFHNIGCICGMESLASREFVCTGGFVFCPYPAPDRESFWEGGYCLTTTIDRTFDDEGYHMERKHLEMLMDIADREGYSVRDDYYCEILAETPAFSYQGRDMMLRLRLAVDVDDPESSPYFKTC